MLGGSGFPTNSGKPRIAGARLKHPPRDARQYFEDISDIRGQEHGPSQPAESLHERAIYKDLSPSCPPRHTERERADARDFRRMGREVRERLKLHKIRAIAYERPTVSGTSESDGECWGVTAQYAGWRLNWCEIEMV